MGASEMMREVETIGEAELRRIVYELEGDGDVPGPAYPHQVEGLRRIEDGARHTPPVSGILHYPTGAGKTRVGMELIARALKENPRHRFIWATHKKNLIRQSMGRLLEMSRVFPRGTSLAWADDRDVADPENDFDVVFMTRNALTKALERAADARVNHSWRRHLENRDPMTLIYDECHQLQADGLQDAMLKFYRSVVAPPGAWRRPWRAIGLSATPVPTQHESHDLLKKYVFPLRKEGERRVRACHERGRDDRLRLVSGGAFEMERQKRGGL